MSENNAIFIKGARVNNLKNIDVEIPRDKLVVITGLSGSGKSSLAFDTLYAEGQRRYVESLSSYARQFLGRMSKPECDYIKGIPPAIAIEQKVNTRNPRSTACVGDGSEKASGERHREGGSGISDRYPLCRVCPGGPAGRPRHEGAAGDFTERRIYPFVDQRHGLPYPGSVGG